MRLAPTPGQTVGPYFGYALPYEGDSSLVPPGHPNGVRLHGRILDGHGDPVPDALLEVWHAGPDGNAPRGSGSLRRDGYEFSGWGRASTDATGRYSFSTLVPSASFFAITIFARGLLNRLFTRAYLPEHRDDPFLKGIPAERGRTLMATRDKHGFVFDIRLQGDDETVFLTFPRHGVGAGRA